MKSFRHLALALTLLLPLSLSPGASAQSALPGVGAVTYDESDNSLILAIPYQGRNPYRVLWLNGPRRLVVDIEGLVITSKRDLFIGSPVVTRIRAARWNRNTTRVVFDLAQAADLQTITDGPNALLVLNVMPRGALSAAMNQGAPVAAAQQPAPRPAPTSRPRPETRITPVPVFTPPPSAPTPQPLPQFTPAPQATPVPLPEPTFEPLEPLPSEEPVVQEQPFMVFGSRLSVGSDVALSVTESYPAGGSATSVGLAPIGVFSWDQMFTPNVGMSLGARVMGYTVQDQLAEVSDARIEHRRDDIEANLGLRGRFPLFGGLEVMAQPGFMVRTVLVNTTASTVDANGALTPINNFVPPEGAYLYSPWYGYGPSLGAGLGWHLFGPLSIVGTGEFNYLLGGGMLLPNTPGVFPMIGLRGGGELRLDFGFLGLSAGYNYTTYNFSGTGAGNQLSQTWHGPVIKASIVY